MENFFQISNSAELIRAAAWVAALVFCIGVGVAAVVDFKTRRIPNALIAVLLATWAAWHALALILGANWQQGLFATLGIVPEACVSTLGELCGGLLLGGGLLAVALLFDKVSGRSSFGGGDIKLLFAVGLYLGCYRGLLCLAVACVVTVILALFLARRYSSRAKNELSEASEKPAWAQDGSSPQTLAEKSTEAIQESSTEVAQEPRTGLLQASAPFAPGVFVGVICALFFI